MNETHYSETVLFLPNKRRNIVILVIVFLLAGLGVRMIDFTSLPLDFATTRQFHSLIMARGYYYQMKTPDTLSIDQEKRQFALISAKAEPVVEPPILEHLVAYTYAIIGHENIFVGRVYSILFWVLGGIPIFLLAKHLFSINGAMATLAFYELVPFGVFASRSFQPDSMMIMFLIWALYFQISWSRDDTLKNAIFAGLFSGIAILVKDPMIYFTGIPLAGLVLQKGFKFWSKNRRVYLMAILAIIPALVYNLISATVGGNSGAIFSARFFPQLYTQITWYIQWLVTIKATAGNIPLIIGLLAFFFIRSKQDRIFYGCLWLGYLLYGFTFAYHIYSHNYYQLPLLVIVSLGFGIGLSFVFEKLEALNPNWFPRLIIMFVFVFSIGLCVQKTRDYIHVPNNRGAAAYWTEVGEQVRHKGSLVSLTQDYGYLLNYWGYIGTTLWPTTADRDLKNIVGASDPAFKQLFKELTVGKDVFLVTMPDEFDKQTDLKEYLMSTYPVQQGKGYYIFDLAHPLKAVN